jgi:hypothetical protein
VRSLLLLRTSLVVHNKRKGDKALKLQELVGSAIARSFDEIALDVELSRQIQSRLIAIALLEPPVDGKLGLLSRQALEDFRVLKKIGRPSLLDGEIAEALIEEKGDAIAITPTKDLAGRIIRYCLSKGYYVSRQHGAYNIVYVEGMNEDGTINEDAPNEFNDRRIVIEIVAGVPQIVGNWQATTEPGRHYTNSPLNPLGAARIQFGQYKAWQIGMHGNSDRHEALVQIAPVTVCRDRNKDYKRTDDRLDTGLFAINQHWGYDAPTRDIKNASAGCLVGRTRYGHQEFMRLIKSDRRIAINPAYVFFTTVVAGDAIKSKFFL